MGHKTRNRRDLINASEHLCYEIWMFHHMGRALTFGLSGEGPIHNVFINSFAIHVRNLIDFLYESKGDSKADAILAEHYFDSPKDWLDARPPKSDILKKAEIRCAKQVAHLTYTREKREAWEILGIVRELYGSITVFIDNIDRELLGEHFGPIEYLFRRSV